MATVSDLNTTPLSGLNWIDALLDIGPDWNYLTPAGNTLLYTFSVTAGNEPGKAGQEGFTLAQQANVRAAFDYISKLTGIQFTETAIGTAARIHFANSDLQGANVTGLCSWQSSYSYDQSTSQLASYSANAWVYLDNVEWRAENRDLTAGGYGFETLLHELGHALGLKHPFDDSINLPAGQDNTSNTLMSYTDTGGPHAQYSQYDIAALDWLYGGDGLRGALGINSDTGARYITGTDGVDTLTGTAFNDTLEGAGGNDVLHGGNGTDTAVFSGARGDYTFTQAADGSLKVTGLGATDTLDSIELLRFADGTWSSADALAGTAPVGSTPAASTPVASTPVATPVSTVVSMAGTAQGDSITPGAGDHAIDGGAGTDTVVYNAPRANFTVTHDAQGFSVVDNAGTGGHDSLVNVERLHFSDADIALDVAGVAGQAFRLYQAAFDRPAEAAGLGYWIARMESGTTLEQAAKEFMTGQPEFDTLYGKSPTDADFVTHLYNNVLHRAAEGSGYDYWMNVLSTHGATRAQVLAFFSESAENQAQVVGTIQDGMAYTPWHG